jgi:hypothetical protein
MRLTEDSTVPGYTATNTSATEWLSSVPLYAKTDPTENTVEFLGSGTLVRFRNRDLLVSAAHVVENGRKFSLMVAGPRYPVIIDRPALLTPIAPGLTRETDPLDFCAYQLLPEETEKLTSVCRFIDWENEAITDVSEANFTHKVTGYPDTANDIKPTTKSVRVNCLRVDVTEDPNVIRHAPWPGMKAHPTWYIGLRYDPRSLERRETRPKVPSLHGCSGAAIWRTDKIRTLGFAGIVTQCLSPKPRRTGERLFYGLRAIAINDLLTAWIDGGHL